MIDAHPPSSRGAAGGVLMAAGAAALVALVGAAALRTLPLARSWRATRAAGAYRVAGLTRAETAAGATTWRVLGRGDTGGALTLTLFAGEAGADLAGDAAGADGAGAADAAATTWRIRWPEVSDGAGRALPRRALGAVLPVGDPLVLVATGHAARVGALEAVGAGACRRVDFRVGARAYGTWWEAHPAFLPVNAEAGGLWTFEGAATAWLDPATGRPCRIAARVDLPRLGDDLPGRGTVDWTYDWDGATAEP